MSAEIKAVFSDTNLILAKGDRFSFSNIAMRRAGLGLIHGHSLTDAVEIIGKTAAVMHQLAMLWDQLPDEDTKQNRWSMQVLKEMSDNFSQRLADFQTQHRTQGVMIISLGFLDMINEMASVFYVLAVGDI